MVDIRWLCCKFKIGRSICRSPLDPPRSPGGRRFRRLRPDPADRSPGPFRSRPLVSSVSVQFVAFRPFVARSSSSARSVLGSSSVRLLFRSARLVRFIFLRSRSVPARSFLVRFVQVSLGLVSCSGSVQFCLVLCSRLLACRFIYIILAYIIHYMGRKANEFFIEKHVFFDNIRFHPKLSPPRTIFPATFPLKPLP